MDVAYFGCDGAKGNITTTYTVDRGDCALSCASTAGCVAFQSFQNKTCQLLTLGNNMAEHLNFAEMDLFMIN